MKDTYKSGMGLWVSEEMTKKNLDGSSYTGWLKAFYPG